jgi:hypothetical protein
MTLPPETSDPVVNVSSGLTSAESRHVQESGTVHISGPAIQNVLHSSIEKNFLFNHQVVQQLLGNSGRAALLRHEFDAEALQVYRDAYEPVREHAKIVDRLTVPGSVVVLTAKRRSGRRTAAICCLFDHDRVNPLIREIQVDADVPLEVHKESVRQGEGLILNLGDSDPQDELWRTTARSLASFSTTLSEKRARLVVIAPCGDPKVDPSWQAYQLPVSSPEPLDVLRAHLKVRMLSKFTDQWCDEAKRYGILEDAFPEDAARLAELLEETASVAIVDPEEIFKQAVAAFTDWAEDLRVWFDEEEKPGHKNPEARALITSVAAVEGADRATVLTARDLLLKNFGRDCSEDEDFFGLSTATRISQVNASISGGRVRFTKPGYGPAVLHHIWSERGRSSSKILKWMISLPRQCSLSDEVVSDMVDKLIRLADRHNDLNIIEKAVDAWSKEATSTRPFIEHLLTRAALSTQIGSKARRKLYDLAKGGSATAHIAVAAVCGGELAHVFPDIAFVRLRLLAQRSVPEVQAAVVEAMNRVASHQWPRALRESTTWVKDRASQSVGVNCLAHLLHLDQYANRIIPLIADFDQMPGSSGDLVNAWSTLFTLQLPGKAVSEAMATWLDTAFKAPEHQQPVLRVLASAAAVTPLRLSSLREGASWWSGNRYGSDRPDLEDRIDLRERLMAMAEQSLAERNLLELNSPNRDVSMRENL